ncbi:MAG: hypothetical protein UU76_C0020G0010 [Parcubacteria group bacterium GW2011_GWC1_41_7]|nr:MAG: hypothetical protein UU76_C0020G0010 [Parcubacteria group bacterium GW2011_GWC1_41_7]
MISPEQQLESPLEVISQLLEKKNLDFSEVNLVTVADDFLQYIQGNQLDAHIVGDYLMALSKLLVLKLNHVLKIAEPDPEIKIDLERFAQVRIAKGVLKKMIVRGPIMFSSERMPQAFLFLPPPITKEQLKDALLIISQEPVLEEKEIVLKKKISLQKTLDVLKRIIAKKHSIVLQETFEGRDLMLAVFLASLILYREGMVDLQQEAIFDKIIIAASEPSHQHPTP